MAHASHKHAARRRPRHLRHIIVPTLGLITVFAAGTAVVLADDPSLVSASIQHRDLLKASVLQPPTKVSRSAERAPLPDAAKARQRVTGHRFAVTALEVHTSAKDTSPVLATVRPGETVEITGKSRGQWAQIMHKDLPRWVLAEDIATVMPLGSSACASGSAVERGLQPDTTTVHRAVCAKFPQVIRYGGRAGRGEHATGRAIDIMVGGDRDLGEAIAAFARNNASKLGVSQVIWYQRIWTVQRAGDGWRGMPNRGSVTANHMDHVHVTTYGNAAR